MASFITNSTNTVAVRKDLVVSVFITNTGGDKYALNLTTRPGTDRVPNLDFETATTLQGIQVKAAAVLAALEAE